MTRLADQDARDRIRDDLGSTLVVEAAAGTGKTSELVRRMVAVVSAGRARLVEMVAVTFTEAAAGEMKLRLRARIEETRQTPATPEPARARLGQALAELEEARIGTIHSLCADLLREHPVEAGVDPAFEIAADDVASGLFERAFDRWFEEQLAEPGAGVRRVLRRRTRHDEGPRALLRAAAWELAERRDFPTPWAPSPFAREAAIDAILEEAAALAGFAAAGEPDDYFTQSLAAIGAFVDGVRRREGVRGGRDYDGLEAELADFVSGRQRHWRWTGFRRTREGFDKPALVARRDALKARIETFLRDAGADLAPRLREDLWQVVERYGVLKERAGCLDFVDLLLRARDLVRDRAEVRAELQRRFTHLFVDEFQDTDPLQAEILLLLAADDPAETDWRRVRVRPGKLFVVGDPKQSIYRFRRADVALYEEVKRRLRASPGADVLHLTVSFRAVPELQEAVNAAFAPRMGDGGASQAGYVPLAPFRSGVATQPVLVALPVPAPYGDYGSMVDWRIEESLPDAVGAFIDWLVRRSRWTVTERDRPDVRVPIAARHVCLLFRRFRSWGDDVTRPYVRALEARRLGHVLVGGGSFHQREEIETLRTALEAIERPDDELMVFATLRGPLFALSDAALLAFRGAYERLHPFLPLPDALPPPLADVAAALAILRDLHRGRNHRPIGATIGRLLAETRAHAGFAIWPTGEQALANVGRLMDLARRAERRGVVSFRGFVERLARDAERGEASEAPIVEEGTEGVRIMTVHRAKGLEFPVVVLADLTANETPREPSRWVDPERRLCAMRLCGAAPRELLDHADEEREREREEATRTLYVAATRARDLLVVPALGDGPYPEGWLAALSPVVYPDPARGGRPETRTPPGCPPFPSDTVTARPERVPRPHHAVAPGLHVPEAGTHRVVWWDPAALELGVREAVGLRQTKLLEVDERGLRSEQGIAAHGAWQAAGRATRAAAAAPSLRVTTATEHAAREGAAVDVAIAEVAVPSGRPHGTRFGSLVHAVLATVALDAEPDAVAAAAGVQARILGATDAEASAAVDAVVAALGHPLLVRAAEAARAGCCRREVPVTLRLDDGTLVEGVVDAAFCDGGTWTVIDFKTDVEIAGRLEEYRRQAALYARAVAGATGAPARAVLLRL
ncbi:MAG TPA: UvrD-helicase domain-containing protein [Candidatus Binatia bacterium]|nr:UvrD-helicase domain-containing protein [Candidatus Binatia bacterium]